MKRNLDYVPYSTNIYPNVQGNNNVNNVNRQPLSRVNETPLITTKRWLCSSSFMITNN